MENTPKSLKLKAIRERLQIWLSNQNNCSWFFEKMDILMKDENIPILIQWDYSCDDYVTSENVRVIAKDVIKMLLMSEILVAL